jgi:D-sedoheptulose 7-phosphate isomerase
MDAEGGGVMLDPSAKTISMLPKAENAHFEDYRRRLLTTLETCDWQPIAELADELLDCARTGRQVFLAGNGGSAANAVHLANDFLYAWSKQQGRGIRVNALPANTAILSCLANDEGYDQVFSGQLAVHAQKDDLLLVFSSSGNSGNILRALEQARDMGVKSFAVLGFDGGKAKAMCDVPIHFAVDDTQIAEDVQLILGHMIVQHLHAHRDVLERP